jgi:hypothetical protein
MLKFYNVVLFTLHLNFTGCYYLYPEEGKSFVFELIPYPIKKCRRSSKFAFSMNVSDGINYHVLFYAPSLLLFV